MEIIYRVYEIVEDDNSYFFGNGDKGKNTKCLDQTICICESRKHFKEIMTDMYAPKKVHFANRNNLDVGEIYICIISEKCYDTEKYFVVNDYKCNCCGKDFKNNEKLLVKMRDNYRFSSCCNVLYNKEEKEINNMVFCSIHCMKIKQNEIIERYKKFNEENDLMPDSFVSKENFYGYNRGYIYMITKKSTNEFYVGQTKYAPIFRWGQHLLTERFKIDNIVDYKFEVLETFQRDMLNEREAYWINKKRDENPSLSLNIVIPKMKTPDLFDILK